MSELTLLNKRTVSKKIRDIALLVVLGLGIYQSPKLINLWQSHRQQSGRIAEFREKITAGDFYSAEQLLDVYSNRQILAGIDLDVLRIELAGSKIKKQVSDLDKLVKDGDYSQSRILFESLAKENILTPEQKASYDTQIEKNSPKNTAERIIHTPLSERAGLVSRFAEKNPEYPEIDKLKSMGLESYVSLSEKYASEKDFEKTLETLKDFKKYLGICKREMLSSFNFNNFYRKMDDFIAIGDNRERSFELGDRIRIVRACSKIRGGPEGQYWLGGNTNQMHLGTVGYITEFSQDSVGKHMGCIMENSGINPWYFIKKEIVHENDTGELASVYGDIKNYIGGEQNAK